jgi:hypothetical protein
MARDGAGIVPASWGGEASQRWPLRATSWRRGGAARPGQQVAQGALVVREEGGGEL